MKTVVMPHPRVRFLMSHSKSLCLVFLAVVLCGCTDQDARRDVLILRGEQKQLADTLNSNVDEIARMRLLVQVLEVRTQMDEWTQLQLPSGGVSKCDTWIGPLLAGIEGIERTKDGLSLKYTLGNPSSATISGYTLNARWGKELPGSIVGSPDLTVEQAKATFLDFRAWESNLTNIALTFTNQVPAGSWIKGTLPIGKSELSGLGILQIRITPSSVNMPTR